MSKRVVTSVSPIHAKNVFGSTSDKVIDVSTSITDVADQSDLDYLENRLKSKIETLQHSFNKLEVYLKKIAAETEKMPEEVKKEVQKLAEQQKIVLDNEYKKIVDDMAKKCADISTILKK